MSSQGSAQSARGRSRLLAIDAGRPLATFAILWVHISEIEGVSAPLASFGRFGTSFYIVSAVLLSVRSALSGKYPTASALMRSRAKRLLIPYVLWSLIYATFYIGTMQPQGYPLSGICEHWGVLAGTAQHLWFLPFAFAASVLAILLGPPLAHRNIRPLALGGLALTFLVYLCTYVWILPNLDPAQVSRLGLHRFDRWLEEVPLAVGAIFGSVVYEKQLVRLARLGAKKRRRLALAALAGFACVEVAYWACLEDLRPLFWTEVRVFANVAGALLFVALIAARSGPRIQKMASLGRATYFAFLCHMLLVDMTKKGLSTLPGHGTVVFALAVTSAVFAAGVALGSVAPKTRGLRWLAP